ncbi:hypothetical protein B0A50_00668 [Salinomyces thailandicus]|uniref:Cryptic loci regulator 2 N-terminal domain-containing protein n=1 Tax=Salinomyces thailandicus TaxID=706561 RepID=A0A4U0UFB1_9PEZI|nr:hypothetical protein B0A50_00668 [Salinomyces thailandica]
MAVQILNINPGSDGNDNRRPATDDYRRNDSHWQARIGEMWAADLGYPKGAKYSLNSLPHGFAGYEKSRASGSTHVDRYVYGHPTAVFRSAMEFYPHFKHLMDNGNALGCPCKICSGNSRKRNAARSVGTAKSAKSSPYFTSTNSVPNGHDPLGSVHSHGRSPPQQMRKKQVDEEGTTDVLRTLIDRLKAAGADQAVDELIIETMSPDWRVNHTGLYKELKSWRKLPAYVPRKGELVLFVRHLEENETLVWDSQTFRTLDRSSKNAGSRPLWEAGVVTQMPVEAVTDEDLSSVPSTKQHNVTLSGFRVEPIPAVQNSNKSFTRQHKYLPLHAIRPLCLWKECLQGLGETDWHATIRHALTVCNTMCTLGRYHFKGQWPDATIFCQGAYIGPEFVQLGDAVRLHPRLGDKHETEVTDVMVVTAVKMRLVNLDEANDDDWDNAPAYNTCTHISGRTFTQDPARSFDGIGKVPIPEDSETLHPSMKGIGTWYHVCDPKNERARIEVPYTRVIGRCYERAALTSWFTIPEGIAPQPASFQPVNPKPLTPIITSPTTNPSLSRGLPGILDGRTYALAHDPRIAPGKSWYWADSRVEALDVHEVNGRWVSFCDEKRNAQKLNYWRRALRALDGKKGGLEEFHAARRVKEMEAKRRGEELKGAGSGLVAGGAQAQAQVQVHGQGGGKSGPGTEPVTETEAEVWATGEDGEGQEGYVMDVDQLSPPIMPGPGPGPPQVIMGDEDSDVEVHEQSGGALAAFKAGAVSRTSSGTGIRAGGNVIELDDDDEDEDEDDD